MALHHRWARSSLSLIALASCTAETIQVSDGDGDGHETAGDSDGDGDTTGDGDGEPTGDGDGDGDSTGDGDGDGDGDPTGDGDLTGDGDGDGDGDATGDGDGDGDGDATGDGDGDGDPPGDGDGDPVETCSDGLQNQDESDIDCGGRLCGTCLDGSACLVPADCTSAQCVDGYCFSGCIDDEACASLTDDCSVGVCNEGMCEAAPANEGAACASGGLCLVNGLCNAGTCIEEWLDCTHLDAQCVQGNCNPDDGSCVATPVLEGMACDDDDNCTAAEVCTAGECIDPIGGAIFYEEFANNNAGWTLDNEWELGPAVTGCGDPGTDHSPTANDRVAGVNIGGCAVTSYHSYYCLTSPIIDTAGQTSVWMTYYRDLYTDSLPWMKHKLEVWNGNAWVILFETFWTEVNDLAWQYVGYDVSAHANANMRFRWCHSIVRFGGFNRGSWNVDDVTVAPVECNASN